jgi:DivIVA domain-containing protein
MMWVFAIVVVIVLGGVAVVAAGRGTPMAPAYDDRPDALVPADRPLTGADLRELRFSVALRGYRMSEVDALLTRLGAELDAARDPGDSGPRPAPEPAPEPAPGLVDPPTSEEHDAPCP